MIISHFYNSVLKSLCPLVAPLIFGFFSTSAFAAAPGTYNYCPSTPLNGKATYFDLVSLPHCSYPSTWGVSNGYSETVQSPYWAAINDLMYNTGAGVCGACAQVDAPAYGTRIIVQIIDECPLPANSTWCYDGSNHLDLSKAAFTALAGSLGPGFFNITWEWVECPLANRTQSNLSYMFKNGSSQWWTAIQFRDNLFPIANVEYSSSAGGPWTSMTWQTYNYWLEPAGVGPGNSYYRITDDRGNVVVTNPIACCTPAGSGSPMDNYTVGQLGDTGVQHPGCGPVDTPTQTPIPIPSATETPCICSPTFTSTPTPVPVDCPLAFNLFENMTENGSWSGSSANRSLSTSNVTQGSTSMLVDVTSVAAFNSNVLRLTSFSPVNLGIFTRVSFDMYVVPGSLFNASSTYEEVGWFFDAPGNGKWTKPLTVGGPQPMVDGWNNFNLAIDTAQIFPADTVTVLYLVLNQQSVNALAGTFYIDNLIFHTDAACPPPSPTATNTPLPPTQTSTPSVTASSTPVPPTSTFTATRTASPTSSTTLTHTPIPPTSTFTATRTASPTSSITPTDTPVPPTSTFTDTRTASPTSSITPTDTPVPPTSTFTDTRTASPTSSITLTDTPIPPTSTHTFSPTVTNSSTPTSTLTVTPTVTASSTATPTHTPTLTNTFSPTVTRSSTGTLTLTVTSTDTATRTITATSTGTPTKTISPTATATPTVSPTKTLTATQTSSPTLTPLVPSATITPLPPTGTVTLTSTVTATPSRTPTVTITKTPRKSLIDSHGLYPNPFVRNLKVFYVLRDRSEVTMTIFNVAGEVVLNKSVPGEIGSNLVLWEGVNNSGARVASGTYLIHIKAETAGGKKDDFWTLGVARR